MIIRSCNIEGAMDSHFREFLSQPGERQRCSELLHSILKGRGFDSKDFLKLPNGSTSKNSPKNSPVGSPRNVSLLSPIFLPPSPRSPSSVSPLNASGLIKLSNSFHNQAVIAHSTAHSSFQAKESDESCTNSFTSTMVDSNRNNIHSKLGVSHSAPASAPASAFSYDIDMLSRNRNTIPVRAHAKSQAFSTVFNEAMGLGSTPFISHSSNLSLRRQLRKKDFPSSPPSPTISSVKQLEAAPTSPTSPTISGGSPKFHGHLRESSPSNVANKENARPCLITSPLSPSSPLASSSSQVSPLSPTGNALSHQTGGVSPLGPAGAQSPRIAGRRLAKSTKNLLIPRFYYPMGRPMAEGSQEQKLQRVSQCFRENGGQISKDSVHLLTRACQVPLYWKAPLFTAAGGEKLGYLTQEQFTDYWERVLSSCHDNSSRFVRVLSRGLRNHLLPEDFLGLIQDVVDTHPGLTFLKEATEFHSRYVHTVIARIYYCVNRSWSGRITVPELRRSNLLQVISYLEEEEDINKITDYFSYEHFYVIYCKFWELDTDHDLFIDKHDLSKHNERALSWRVIERIFSGAVTRGRVQKQDRMGYQEFVWFLISEEDKRHPTAIEYWFRCMDLDGDGYLSMYELEYFYEEQLQRMEALGEILPFTDCLCQMLDMVRPAEENKISLSDLKKCRMTPVFFDTFFNLEKYLDHEQRDPFASQRMDDEGTEMSDWDRYAAEEYELLVAEEGGGDQQDDMLFCDDDELSMGVDEALEGGADAPLGLEMVGEEGDEEDPITGGYSIKGSLRKHSPLSATVTNLALDHMDVDEYSDYADSDDYQY